MYPFIIWYVTGSLIIRTVNLYNGTGYQFMIIVVADLDRCYIIQDIPRILKNILDRNLDHIPAGTDGINLIVLICVHVGLEYNLSRAPSCVLTGHTTQ
jgi:hypothetical protein